MKRKVAKRASRAIAIFVTVFMLMGMMPQMAFAGGIEDAAGTAYISISFDGQYIYDKNDKPVAHVPVDLEELKNIDLSKYGLEDYAYDADGDGQFETAAVHMYIYVHENILGKSWNDVSVTGGVGSIFFESGLFGFEDCNLNYYFNGEYPAIDGWGITADQLVIEDGDFIDVAGYTSWGFYGDSAFGFHYFADKEGNITHSYTADSGVPMNIKLIRTASVMGAGMTVTNEPNYAFYYSKTLGDAEEYIETDSNGCAEIVFPESGKWYLWCDGNVGNDNPEDIVSSPGFAVVEVKNSGSDKEENDTESKTLAEIKMFAKKEIAAYKDISDYREAQRTELTAAVEEANKAIDAAVTEGEVSAAITAAKNKIDKIKTDAQLDKEEVEAAAKVLAEAKLAAKKEINSYKNVDIYRDAQKEELSSVIEVTKRTIDAAVTEAEISAAVTAGKNKINMIKTDAQLAKEEAEAKDAADRKAAEVAAAALKKPETAVAKLRTASGGYNDVVFSWNKVEEASGYEVYYKKAADDTYTKLTSTTDTTVTKKNLSAGAKYYFKVVPYASVGEYICSAEVYKTSSVYTLKKISKPKVTKSGSKVKIRWTNINGETGYQISKSTKKSGTKIVATYKTTTGKSKLIKATKGKKYYYKVRAYKNYKVGNKTVKVYGPWSNVKAYRR